MLTASFQNDGRYTDFSSKLTSVIFIMDCRQIFFNFICSSSVGEGEFGTTTDLVTKGKKKK